MRENLEIKVCGNKFPTNALAVCQFQIDYMGFIFHEESPRNVENFEIFDVLNKASLEGFSPKRVGVFVSKTEDEVLNKVRKHNLQIVQAHGLESPLFCQKLKEEGLEVWKVFGVEKGFSFDLLKPYLSVVDAFLFDTKTPYHGGSGQKFDWEIIEDYPYEIPFFLSGGIGPNDAKAIKCIQNPYLKGVDVNSGFEISKGVKDIEALKGFVKKIKIEEP